MASFHWQRFLFRLARAPIAVLFLILISALLARSVWGVYKKGEAAAERSVVAQRELQDLAHRHAALEREIRKLEAEEGIEEALRAQFQVGKPGEGVIILKDEARTPSAPEASAPPAKTSWFARVGEMFGF